MIYSVMSLRQDYSAEELRSASPIVEAGYMQPYLQLPETVTQRTRDLAREIAGDAPTEYDKVIAVRDYVRNTYPYDYFPPPQPLTVRPSAVTWTVWR